MDDVNEMVIFSAVATHGSFTAAAHSLGLQKSKVSRKVASLEERLSTQLLLRSTRSLTLTEAGKVYFQHCRRVAEEVDAANIALSQMQTLPTGTLKISAPAVFGSEILTLLLRDFQEQYQQVDVDIVVTNHGLDLLEHHIDVSFGATESSHPAYNSTPLGKAARCICASPGYLEQWGQPSSPDALNKHRIVLFKSWLNSNNWTFRKEMINTTINVSSRFETDDLSTAHRAAVLGMGISMLPLAIVATDIAEGKLIPLLTDWQLKPNQLYLCYHKDAYLTPKVRAFVDFVIESYKPRAPWSYSLEELLTETKTPL